MVLLTNTKQYSLHFAQNSLVKILKHFFFLYCVNVCCCALHLHSLLSFRLEFPSLPSHQFASLFYFLKSSYETPDMTCLFSPSLGLANSICTRKNKTKTNICHMQRAKQSQGHNDNDNLLIFSISIKLSCPVHLKNLIWIL